MKRNNLPARELDSTFGELTSERFFGKDEVFVDDFKILELIRRNDLKNIINQKGYKMILNFKI